MPILTNVRHEAYAQALVLGSSKKEAYMAAGYTATGHSAEVNAERLLRKAAIAARVAELRAVASQRAEVTAADVLRGLAALAFTDPREIMQWDDEGRVTVTPSSELSPAAASMVSSVKLTTTRISDISIRETLEVKLIDRKGALDSLAKALGMFVERQEHSGPNGGPIPLLAAVANLTDRQLRQLVEGGDS